MQIDLFLATADKDEDGFVTVEELYQASDRLYRPIINLMLDKRSQENPEDQENQENDGNEENQSSWDDDSEQSDRDERGNPFRHSDEL